MKAQPKVPPAPKAAPLPKAAGPPLPPDAAARTQRLERAEAVMRRVHIDRADGYDHRANGQAVAKMDLRALIGGARYAEPGDEALRVALRLFKVYTHESRVGRYPELLANVGLGVRYAAVHAMATSLEADAFAPVPTEAPVGELSDAEELSDREDAANPRVSLPFGERLWVIEDPLKNLLMSATIRIVAVRREELDLEQGKGVPLYEQISKTVYPREPVPCYAHMRVALRRGALQEPWGNAEYGDDRTGADYPLAVLEPMFGTRLGAAQGPDSQTNERDLYDGKHAPIHPHNLRAMLVFREFCEFSRYFKACVQSGLEQRLRNCSSGTRGGWRPTPLLRQASKLTIAVVDDATPGSPDLAACLIMLEVLRAGGIYAELIPRFSERKSRREQPPICASSLKANWPADLTRCHQASSSGANAVSCAGCTVTVFAPRTLPDVAFQEMVPISQELATLCPNYRRRIYDAWHEIGTPWTQQVGRVWPPVVPATIYDRVVSFIHQAHREDKLNRQGHKVLCYVQRRDDYYRVGCPVEDTDDEDDAVGHY